MVTQSDYGTENYNIAYAQTFIRQELDPELSGTLQHNWMRGHTNIKPERAWARLRDMWSKGFEDMFDEGIQNQWYNPGNTLDRYVATTEISMRMILILCSLTFQWLAIPFIQRELNQYVMMHNTTRRRAHKHKILPHGIPQQMFMRPSIVDSYDFKVWLWSLPHTWFPDLC